METCCFLLSHYKPTFTDSVCRISKCTQTPCIIWWIFWLRWQRQKDLQLNCPGDCCVVLEDVFFWWYLHRWRWTVRLVWVRVDWTTGNLWEHFGIPTLHHCSLSCIGSQQVFDCRSKCCSPPIKSSMTWGQVFMRYLSPIVFAYPTRSGKVGMLWSLLLSSVIWWDSENEFSVLQCWLFRTSYLLTFIWLQTSGLAISLWRSGCSLGKRPADWEISL